MPTVDREDCAAEFPMCWPDGVPAEVRYLALPELWHLMPRVYGEGPTPEVAEERLAAALGVGPSFTARAVNLAMGKPPVIPADLTTDGYH